MSAFVLVHGAWHGAWCWERLVPQLEAEGHQAIAMDLPCDDQGATFDTYAEVVVAALDRELAQGEEVVLVGHSLAGHTIPLVAARRSVSRLVYVCGLVPIPGHTFADQVSSEPDMLQPGYLEGVTEPDEQGRTRWKDADVARRVFYADCEEGDARAAFGRLRPQARTPYIGACPLEQFSPTPCTYVVCSEDRVVNPGWSRRIARERLDADLVELPGSHSPFLSRPGELAALLTQRH